MKRIFQSIAFLAATFLLSFGIVQAASILYPYQGGTGYGVAPAYGNVLVGNANGIYVPTATSSLGIVGGSGTPSGTTGQIQYNNAGSFGGTTTQPLYVGTLLASSTAGTSTFAGSVSIGTTTSYAQLSVAGQGTVVPFAVASSTGGQLFSIQPNGQTLIGNQSNVVAPLFLKATTVTVAPGYVSQAAVTSQQIIGGLGVASSDGLVSARGLYGVGISSGTQNGYGFFGYATSSAASDAGSNYGSLSEALAIHTGGNTGVLGIAQNSTSINSGVEGDAYTNTSLVAAGLSGFGFATNSSDTGSAEGVAGQATATHAGGSNIAVYGNAVGGNTNYSFYGNAGTLYNVNAAGIATTSPWGTFSVTGLKSAKIPAFVVASSSNATLLADVVSNTTIADAGAGSTNTFVINGTQDAPNSLSGQAFTSYTPDGTNNAAFCSIGGTPCMTIYDQESDAIDSTQFGTAGAYGFGFYINESVPVFSINPNGSLSLGSGGYADNLQAPSAAGFILGGISAQQPGEIGIGTSTPFGLLSVSNFPSASTNVMFDVASSTNKTLFDILADGRVGMGTTTPFATFSEVAASSTAAQSGIINLIAGIENTTVKLFQEIDQWGHLITSGDTPTVTSCGSTPNGSVSGNDRNGTITVGGTATGCTLTFAHTYATAPDCVISNQGMSVVNALTYTVSTSAITISQTGLSSDVVNYICQAHQ